MVDQATKSRNQSLRLVLDIVLAIAAVLAAASLVMLYGWTDRPPLLGKGVLGLDGRQVLVVIQLIVAGVLVAERFGRMVLAPPPREFFRNNWGDFAMIAVAVLAVLAGLAENHALAGDAMWVIFAQVYIVFALAMRVADCPFWSHMARVHPLWLLVGGFIFLSLAGALLLILPASASTNAGLLWFQDALFVATSAVTLTGLSLRDVGTEFSFLGQFIILALIQIGGLAIMIFGSALAVSLGRGLGLRGSSDRPTLQGDPDCRRRLDLGRMARFIVIATVSIELVGAILLYPMFIGRLGAQEHALGPLESAWYAVFHSVSAFCNAGFCLWQHNVNDFREHWQMLGIVGPLVILGGLGMPVLQDILRSLATLAHRIKRRLRAGSGPWKPVIAIRLSLHSRVVLWTSLLLLFFGTSGILLVETVGLKVTAAERGGIFSPRDIDIRSDFERLSPSERLQACGMLSISSRTGGFSTFNLAEMSDAGKAVTCMLMAVGASPASTGGGMKTVTFALLVVVVITNLRRRDRVDVFGKTISQELIQNAVTMIAMYALFVAAITIVLSVFGRTHNRFMDVLFESISACSNVGLSTGLTKDLNDPGKFDLIFAMLAGRLGLPALALAMTLRLRKRQNVVLG